MHRLEAGISEAVRIATWKKAPITANLNQPGGTSTISATSIGGTEPACWMQTANASGFPPSSCGPPGSPEVECQLMGHQVCCIGKLVEWGLAGDDPLASSMKPSGPDPRAPALQTYLDTRRHAGQQPSGRSRLASTSVMHMVRRAATGLHRPRCALFLGESGSAREVFAPCIALTRAVKLFVAVVTGAAIPEQLIESELFGVE